MGTGEANAYCPDVVKANQAAKSIFTIIDLPSEIDPIKFNDDCIDVDAKNFKGHIEFVDVWFRYPTRPKYWVLKGLNLKIRAKESVAIIGKSG